MPDKTVAQQMLSSSVFSLLSVTNLSSPCINGLLFSQLLSPFRIHMPVKSPAVTLYIPSYPPLVFDLHFISKCSFSYSFVVLFPFWFLLVLQETFCLPPSEWFCHNFQFSCIAALFALKFPAT